MQRLFRTLALLMLLSFGGCGPSRTELGYGFYQLDEPAWHIIRRERDDTGEIVDRNWWPSRYEVENYYFLGSTTTGSQILYLLVPEGQPVPSDLSEEEVRAFLHSTIRFVGLNLEHATIEELGTYNDYIAPLGADDPLRRQIDMSLDILVWLSSQLMVIPVNKLLVVLLVLLLILPGCKGPDRTELGYGFYKLEKPSGKLVRRERDEDGKVIERVWVEGYDGWVEGGSQVVARFDTRVMVQHFPDMRDIDSGDIGAQFQRLKEKSTYSVIRLDTAQTDELGTIDDIMASYPEGDIVRVTAELPYRLMGEIGEWLGEAMEKITAPAGR